MSLVAYVDYLMKKGLKGLPEPEIEAKLDEIILIFRFLADKDVFEGYYKSSLAKRLLYNKSISDDAEKGMVHKLKSECGCQYTQRIEVMMKDMHTSEETNREFRGHPYYRRSAIDLSVKVLTTGNWPNDSAPSACTLPKELVACKNLFTEFYMNKHSGRVMTWKCNLGEADLRAIMGQNRTKHEFVVSTY